MTEWVKEWIVIVLQVHRGGRVSAADPSATEESSGTGAEVHLQQRPPHSQQEPAGWTGTFTLQKPDNKVRQNTVTIPPFIAQAAERQTAAYWYGDLWV